MQSCRGERVAPNPTVLRTPTARANRPSRHRQGSVPFRRPSGSVPSRTRTRTPLGSEANAVANSLLYRLTEGVGDVQSCRMGTSRYPASEAGLFIPSTGTPADLEGRRRRPDRSSFGRRTAILAQVVGTDRARCRLTHGRDGGPNEGERWASWLPETLFLAAAEFLDSTRSPAADSARGATGLSRGAG